MKNQTFTRPVRGMYAIRFPVVFTRKEVLSPKWPQMRAQLLDYVTNTYDDLISNIETKVRQKK
jgi:hypothetical protein